MTLNGIRKMVLVLFVLVVGTVAWAQSTGLGNVHCTVTVPSDGGAISTSTNDVCPSADGGGCPYTAAYTNVCDWPKGANVDMQCDTDVYVNKDGGTAASTDWKATFTSPQTDPVTIFLQVGEKHISVKNVTAGSGNVCRFGPSWRPKPKF